MVKWILFVPAITESTNISPSVDILHRNGLKFKIKRKELVTLC